MVRVTVVDPLCARLSLQKRPCEKNENKVKPESVFKAGEQRCSRVLLIPACLSCTHTGAHCSFKIKQIKKRCCSKTG